MAASATWPALRADALSGRRALVPVRSVLAVAPRALSHPRASVPVLARLDDVLGTPRGFAAGGSHLAAGRRPALASTFASAARRFARASASGQDDAVAAPESFADLGLEEALVAATDSMGLTRPTDIQAFAIPKILSGGHFLVASHTGSGKTLSYLLPVIQQMKDAERQTGARAKPKRPRVLIVGPTRALAAPVTLESDHCDALAARDSGFLQIHCATCQEVRDGVLLAYDQLIPGSTVLGFLNADHWAIVVPVNREHAFVSSTFIDKNDFPREVLLEALTRYIERDLGE